MSDRRTLTTLSTRWLSDREREISQGRLAKEVGIDDEPDESEKSRKGMFRGLTLALTDPKVWALAYVSFLCPALYHELLDDHNH